MTDWTRRNVLKSGLAAAGASLVTPAIARALDAAGSSLPGDGEAPVAPALPPAESPRERFLLDFGWRFLLGRGADLGPEFGWNNGNGFNKAGNLFPASNPKFDASAWREVNLPHDWAIELPFVNDKQLGSWGFKPVGRGYPDTSFGWYRRTFTLP
ncbi:MAG TPA: hypothetical protein VFJ74_13125, partial [Gemmatimonadaceae bacterium]|nr:hypothetical protein [Gemmatimonadaceae bacterium]